MGTDTGETRRRGAWFRRVGRRLALADPIVADSVLAIVLAVPLLIDLRDLHAPPPPFREADLFGYAVVSLLVVPLALRRKFPVAVFGVTLAAAICTTLVAYRPASFGFGLIVTTYTVARWCDRTISLAALAISLGFSVFVKVRFILAGIDIGLFAWPLDAAYFAGAWFLGDSIRTRTRQAAELERNREELALQAVEHEHMRIARELHDSIGHSLTAIVLYTTAAKRAIVSEPERLHALLDTVSATSNEALAEMDHLVRVLREEPTPSRSIIALDALVDEFTVLGLPVAVTISGSRQALPAAVNLSAYRIVQEALTNTLKHANATRADVRLEYAPDALVVTVTDDGTGCPTTELESTNRHGFAGMRERAVDLGGDLRTAPGPGGTGFTVCARLPLDPEASR